MAYRKKPFYKSKTIMALIAAVVCVVILPEIGYPLPAEYSDQILTGLVAVILYGLRDAQGGISWKKAKAPEPTNGAG